MFPWWPWPKISICCKDFLCGICLCSWPWLWVSFLVVRATSSRMPCEYVHDKRILFWEPLTAQFSCFAATWNFREHTLGNEWGPLLERTAWAHHSSVHFTTCPGSSVFMSLHPHDVCLESRTSYSPPAYLAGTILLPLPLARTSVFTLGKK